MIAENLSWVEGVLRCGPGRPYKVSKKRPPCGERLRMGGGIYSRFSDRKTFKCLIQYQSDAFAILNSKPSSVQIRYVALIIKLPTILRFASVLIQVHPTPASSPEVDQTSCVSSVRKFRCSADRNSYILARKN